MHDIDNGWALLRGRLDDLEAHTDDLGEDPPGPLAFAAIRRLVTRAQERGVDPTRLRIYPDADGMLDLSHYPDGGTTITASTCSDDCGLTLFFSRVGQRTYFRDADSDDAAIDALYGITQEV